MKKIIFDTSFLMDVAKFRIDLQNIGDIVGESFQLATTSQVFFELKRRKSNRNARVAVALIGKLNITILDSKGKDADGSILNLVDKNIIVATNDRELRKRLKRMKVKTIYLRGKKYLEMS